ncbi:uncharacterized protein SPPG_03454 [Spizellomyces punctatus DAOM BR117]|uniref:DM13 domain-containing protein n=1 Tax=Spizellomyces punctatus (strain DAOM BR117) TaxID=645134 RepID=A0A0L0HJL9_SPIPD|nr:uncharacterized protein SPPG_03454 [Spizellomyces punctatus DAOM BR117]KND01656.1 hypothetical protein SPPG_03454 [Spizellomyces punctatus DAOM BR117]|eukprot:XP_016609695.1 hypothetical protein SPPG_03454 [Spizellomyces punctatus DAOM BR117]
MSGLLSSFLKSFLFISSCFIYILEYLSSSAQMARLTSLLFLAALALTGTTAKPCVKTDTRFVGQKATLVQAAQAIPNITQPLQVSGTAEILDGCTFVIRNFVYEPYTDGTVWYGRRGTDGATGVLAARGVNNASTGIDSAPFTFVDTVGAAYSWDDFDTLVLFNPTINFEMGSASFTALRLNATTTTTTAVATSTSLVPSSTTSTTTRSTTTAPATKTSTADSQKSSGSAVGAGGLAAAGLAAAAAVAMGI